MVALLGLLSCAVCFPLTAAADDISDMKQALKQLQEQNQTLMRRISALEAEQAAQRQARARPAQPAPAQPTRRRRPSSRIRRPRFRRLRPDRPATQEKNWSGGSANSKSPRPRRRTRHDRSSRPRSQKPGRGSTSSCRWAAPSKWSPPIPRTSREPLPTPSC